jgi:membrane protein DedA with SNARE-associated domain
MTGILGPLTDWLINLVSTLGYLGIAIAMAIEATSLPIPSEAIMGIAGYLVYKRELNMFLAGLAAATGNILGSTVIYAIGLRGGRPVLKKYGPKLGVTEERFNKVEQWFDRWGDEMVFSAQLIPIVRTFISLPAGILKISFKKFVFYTFSGSFIWCIALIFVSSKLGDQWETLLKLMKEFENVVIIGIIATITGYLIYRFYKARKSKLGVE